MPEITEGWYDDGSGVQRWWDGEDWTEHVQEKQQQSSGGPKFEWRAAFEEMGRRVLAQHDPSTEGGAIWTAVGRPISGIGGARYRLTPEYLTVEKGTLSTSSQQIRTCEIQGVDATQTISQKARGVGSISLWVVRRTGNEQVILPDVPHFRQAAHLISETADEARVARHMWQRSSHTVLEHRVVPPPQGAPIQTIPAPEPKKAVTNKETAAPDINAELERFANLHEQGILTDEEFTAVKRKLLGI